MIDPSAPALAPQTKPFRGSYLLFRLNHGRPPRFRHQTFDAAEAEAQRLLGLHPAATFLIMQEVGRVKLKPAVQPRASQFAARAHHWPHISKSTARCRSALRA